MPAPSASDSEVLPVRVLGGEPVRRGLAPSSLPADVVATLADLRPGGLRRIGTMGP